MKSCGSAQVAKDLGQEVGDVQTRLSRLELLLFRTPVEDFKPLDDSIASLMPKMASSSNIENFGQERLWLPIMQFKQYYNNS